MTEQQHRKIRIWVCDHMPWMIPILIILWMFFILLPMFIVYFSTWPFACVHKFIYERLP